MKKIKEAHRAQILSVRGKGQELTGHTGHKFEWPEDPDGPERPEVHAVLLSLGGILLLLMGEQHQWGIFQGGLTRVQTVLQLKQNIVYLQFFFN